MGWVRQKRRMTGGLALFALALQLVLSFAHTHAEDFVGLRPGLAQTVAAGDTTRGQPDHDHLACDICATVHLAGTLLTPAPPALALPAVFAIAALAATAPRIASFFNAAAFDARGPPQA